MNEDRSNNKKINKPKLNQGIRQRVNKDENHNNQSTYNLEDHKYQETPKVVTKALGKPPEGTIRENDKYPLAGLSKTS